MAGYGRCPGLRLEDIVGRVDGYLGSVVQRHEEPQVRAVELGIPLELNEVIGWPVVAASAGGQCQHQNEQHQNGFHVNPRHLSYTVSSAA